MNKFLEEKMKTKAAVYKANFEGDPLYAKAYSQGFQHAVSLLWPVVEALEFYAKRGHMPDGGYYEMDTRPGKCGYEEELADAQAHDEAYDSILEDLESGEKAREALKSIGEIDD